MAVSKTFSGLNQNALKYLVPTWMSPLSGVAMRLVFGTAAFWGISLFAHKSEVKATAKQKLLMFLLGAVLMTGYMAGLLFGLKYTTPITSSIFISLQPAIVFVICAIFLKEKVTSRKVLGIALGLAGALLCILTQKTSAMASNPMLGGLFSFLSALAYSTYLVLSGYFVKKLDSLTVSKWTFLGGAVTSIAIALIAGWDAPVLEHLWSSEMMALLYILIFPTVISYFLLDIGLRYLKATIVALYGNLILIVSSIASYILKQDVFSWWQILAIAMMIASVYMVEMAEKKASAPQPTQK